MYKPCGSTWESFLFLFLNWSFAILRDLASLLKTGFWSADNDRCGFTYKWFTIPVLTPTRLSYLRSTQ